MKTLAKITAGLCVAFVATMPAFATMVTFQVNMAVQTALGKFNPTTDSVVVAGDAINSWSTSASPLTSSVANSNIWTGTFDLSATAPGTTVQYKYVMNTAGGLVWEGNVGSGGGTANRSFSLAATDQTLPVVYFDNATNSASVTNLITFQVNMSIQTTLGSFAPPSGTVNIAGPFNNWSTSATPMTNSTANTNIWFTTLTLSGALGSAVEYKYIMNGTWENNNVGPGGAQNRLVNLQSTNQVLAPVYFNNVTNTTLPVPIPLTFQVDLAVQIALGNFDPTTGYVEARGSFYNNWGAGFTLTNSPDNTNMFSGTIIDNDVAGDNFGYKFVLNGATWESINNRTYTLTSTNAQALPLVFFNDIDNLGPIAIMPAASSQLALTWTNGPLIWLQSATNLLNASWQDVPNTLGSNSVTLPMGHYPQFFRLTGP